MRRFLLTSAAIAAFAALPAHAAEVFSDGFEGDPSNALNVNPLANWTVTGNVDVVANPNGFGINVTPDASGNVVDLDGSPGPGEITTKDSFVFNAGDLVTLSFVLGGSQRNNGNNDWFTRFIFSDPTGVANGQGTGLLGVFAPVNGLIGPTYTLGGIIGATAPFTTSTYSFRATTAGSLKLAFGTTSRDNIGPLLDNVSLSIGAVPEPATWAMMIMGFGLIGSALRSRKPATVRFATA
ncbi:MAG: PEPxxWA-CTERM sorting domain-containing protein [Sphingopyxis sp.]|nr:PEPxxWA-CTERM sorting domain-containing protein [Sphingopyxis sp.]